MVAIKEITVVLLLDIASIKSKNEANLRKRDGTAPKLNTVEHLHLATKVELTKKVSVKVNPREDAGTHAIPRLQCQFFSVHVF